MIHKDREGESEFGVGQLSLRPPAPRRLADYTAMAPTKVDWPVPVKPVGLDGWVEDRSSIVSEVEVK